MKRILFTLSLVFLVSVLFAQERTVNKIGDANALTELKTLYTYTGTASDVLIPTTTDTIDLVLEYRGKNLIKKISVKSRFDMRTTADTTVIVSVFGKEFADDPTYVQIIGATTSSVVTTNNVIQVLASDYTETVASYTSATTAFNAIVSQETTTNSDTIAYPIITNTMAAQTVTPFDKTYRFYRIRYILIGNDSVGTGVKLDEIEFKIYTE